MIRRVAPAHGRAGPRFCNNLVPGRPDVTAVFLYLLALAAAFVVVSVLLHRETKAERRRERHAGSVGAATDDRNDTAKPGPRQEPG